MYNYVHTLTKNRGKKKGERKCFFKAKMDNNNGPNWIGIDWAFKFRFDYS